MSLLALGINHKTAPLCIRERVSFAPENVPHALQSLLQQPSINEAVLLSTCNRTELYAIGHPDSNLNHWLAQQGQFEPSQLLPHCYQHVEFDAVQHGIRVATGLDSMILGEPQILGQMKQAYKTACAAGTVGQTLQQLFPAVFAATKQIRSKTAIGENPVTLAHTIICLAKSIFAELKNCRVLLVGAGEMIELIATHLHSHNIQQLTIANRSLLKSQQLVASLNGKAISIAEIPAHLKDADIVITATASQLPILGKGMLESTLKQRKHLPMLMVDLGVPRDIEPEIGTLADVYLYDLDNMQQIISQNRSQRATESQLAEEMAHTYAQHYVRQLRILDTAQLIQQYRSQVEKLRDQELSKALKHLKKSNNSEAALATFAHNLTNKFLHKPTQKLREAAYSGNLSLLHAIQEILDES